MKINKEIIKMKSSKKTILLHIRKLIKQRLILKVVFKVNISFRISDKIQMHILLTYVNTSSISDPSVNLL